MRAVVVRWSWLAAGALRISAAEPVFTHIHPAGVQAGTAVAVSLAGKFDPWPCRIYSGNPGLTFTPRKNPGEFELRVDCGVPPGPCLLRAVNAEGASGPVAVMITEEPQVRETEPNDDWKTPQPLDSGPVAVTVNGRMDRTDDVDSYQVTLTKGETLVAWSEASVLAAGFDAMLRLVDSRGVTLAFNHDGPAGMDPLLVFKAPEHGRYVVQTMGHKYPASSDLRFAGGPDCVYRLHLSTGPVLRNTSPLALPDAACGTVTAEGWNLADGTVLPDNIISGPFPPVRSELPEMSENPESLTLAIPSAVSGRIAASGEEDRYVFPATKGEVLQLEVTGPSLGSEIDAWIRVLDDQGKSLAYNDDAGGSSQSRLLWTAPADGTYEVRVGDLTQRGGQDFYYRLTITRPVAEVAALTEAHSVRVESGKSVEVKTTVTFTHGFGAALVLTARPLPPGVSAPGVAVPEKGGDTVLTLTAEAGASPVSQPLRLILTETGSGREHPVMHRMISTSENNGVPQGYRRLLIDETPELWLTLTAPPPPPAPAPASGAE